MIGGAVRDFVRATKHAVRGKKRKKEGVYDQDGLRTIHNHDFIQEPRFAAAYARGCQAASDYAWHWRVHMGLWAAQTALGVEGDFVECGVNRGFLSSAIMQLTDWDKQGRQFYLLDTFEGLDARYVSQDDAECNAFEKNEHALESGMYVRGVESVRRNFAEWKNVRIVQGSIPETLDEVKSAQVAYLHIDMNCSPPEVAAMEFFWDKLTPGAVVLFDDYAYSGYESQKAAMDEFAAARRVAIASLPTGQGLLIKPALRK